MGIDHTVLQATALDIDIAMEHTRSQETDTMVPVPLQQLLVLGLAGLHQVTMGLEIQYQVKMVFGAVLPRQQVL